MTRTAHRRKRKVLLVSANRCTTPEPVFPLGLAHLHAALRRAGHEVTSVDLLFDEDRFETTLKEFQPDLVGISVRNIDDVLIGKRESFVGDLRRVVGIARQYGRCPVVLGGSGFSIFPIELLESTGADFGVVGPGEAALPALLEALRTGEPARAIPGLVFHEDAKTLLNQFETLSCDVPLQSDDWPPQVTARYLENGGMLNIQTQRGCAHRCCYCTYPLIEGPRHRGRTVPEVVSEFEKIQALGARYAFIVDSVFNSSEHHVTLICEELLRRNVKIRWGCFLRPQGLTNELMRLMGRAGLAHIEFGSDSFCDETLKAYRKDFTFEDIRHSTELARGEEIDFCHFVIAGGPGETAASLEQSFENSQRLGPVIIMAVPGMRIYPGTHLFEHAVAEGCLERGANLLTPAYYLAPGLTLEGILRQLNTFAQRSPGWIVGDSNPGYERLVARLRQRGVTGPLWSYFATAQRLWAQPEQTP